MFGRGDLAACLRLSFDRVSRDEPGAWQVALGEKVQHAWYRDGSELAARDRGRGQHIPGDPKRRGVEVKGQADRPRLRRWLLLKKSWCTSSYIRITALPSNSSIGVSNREDNSANRRSTARESAPSRNSGSPLSFIRAGRNLASFMRPSSTLISSTTVSRASPVCKLPRS